MKASFKLLSVILFLISTVHGQIKTYSRQAAEKSFRALVLAKDSDILEVVKSNGLVCLSDSLPFADEDRFLTIVLPRPNDWLQEKNSNVGPSDEQGNFYDGKTDFAAFSFAVLTFRVWENQDWTVMIDSSLGGSWHSYGHYQRQKNGTNFWKPYSDEPPVFRFSEDKNVIADETNLSGIEDGSTFYASKKYKNRNKGITTYEMSMRLSTGRFKETWKPDEGDEMESVGNCYKAKDLAHVTPVPKK